VYSTKEGDDGCNSQRMREETYNSPTHVFIEKKREKALPSILSNCTLVTVFMQEGGSPYIMIRARIRGTINKPNKAQRSSPSEWVELLILGLISWY